MSERKVVLTTGATGAIGSATAVALAKTGEFDLALHYRNASPEKRATLQEEILEAAPSNLRIEFFQADLGDSASIQELHSEITKTMGGIDAFFGNAGSNEGATNKTWKVNVESNILLSQLCLPHMQKQGYGRIILTSSLAALTGGIVGPHYASSKSALHGFIYWLGGSVAKSGVTVNGIAPGLVTGTELLDVGTVANRIRIGRAGHPEEVAETVVWMMKSGYLTRKIVTLDGGIFCR
ncbi:hypothetical protein M409DRAFT_64110 [Zasmidium cellare ATCC 36951]|uniref:Uncharacterized protein n=1 Tax=Zasmidium cellare ATCC 36951 TaxID=1080233 RepID=A0A6A6CWY8_ZASCE|nr:uncharacterized protein M409DRAFT_64110 [Zasmidium cellare ATCC 36951]KAF2170329.1 hypothetical protein M409DRAFT_64110 [Zasmidium cellare ATCC 36951]